MLRLGNLRHKGTIPDRRREKGSRRKTWNPESRSQETKVRTKQESHAEIAENAEYRRQEKSKG